MTPPRPGGLDPRERRVAEAVVGRGLVAAHELAALAAQAMTRPRGEHGSSILAVLVAAGRISRDGARELLAQVAAVDALSSSREGPFVGPTASGVLRAMPGDPRASSREGSPLASGVLRAAAGDPRASSREGSPLASGIVRAVPGDPRAASREGSPLSSGVVRGVPGDPRASSREGSPLASGVSRAMPGDPRGSSREGFGAAGGSSAASSSRSERAPEGRGPATGPEARTRGSEGSPLASGVSRAMPDPRALDPERTVLDASAPLPLPPAQGRHDGQTLAGFGDGPAGFGESPVPGAPPVEYGSSPSAQGEGDSDVNGPPPSDERTIASTPTPGAESGRRRAELAGSVLLTASEDPRQRYAPIDGAPRDVVLDRRLQRPVRRAEPGPADPTLREARLLARLDHPALPRVHDLVGGVKPFATLDLLDGLPLDEQPLDPAGPELRAFLAVASALRHAHRRGLVHGGLGPARVMLGAHGCVWVTGWARANILEGADEGLRAVGDAPGDAPGGDDVPRAPELRGGAAPGVPADVWGLGLVLHWVLARKDPGPAGSLRLGPDVAGDLAEVAAKALARDPRRRYPRVADLEEDVRRFLDGRAVGAVRDTPLRALRRLVRTHPVPTLVGALSLAAVVLGGAVAFTQVRARYRAALAQQELAAEAGRRADESRATAEAALGAARGREALGDLRLRFERALAGHAPERLSEAAALLSRLEVSARELGDPASPALDTSFLRARLLRAQAEHALQEQPRPADALRDAEELVTLLERRLGAAVRPRPGEALEGPFDDVALGRAQLAEAQLTRFLAARRLPGAVAEATEVRALDGLEQLGESAGALGRWAVLEQRVRPVEDDALRRLERRPPTVVPETPELTKLREQVRALVVERPDLAQAHELEGRLATALCAPDLHRSQLPMPGYYEDAFKAFFRASYLDPLDPTPRNLYLREWNAKYGAHMPWRWIGGWALENALWASGQVPRIEPTLEVVDQLQRLGRVASTLPLLERVLADEPGGPRRGEPHARALLAHARARLAAGMTVGSAEVAGLPVPAGYQGDAFALTGWAALLEGDPRRGFELLMRALQTPGSRLVFPHDLVTALTDPRVEPRGLAQVLAQAIPPAEAGQDGSPVVSELLIARALCTARAGADASSDLARIQRLDCMRGYTSEHALAGVAQALQSWHAAPQQPAGHIEALFTWAELDMDVACTEEEADQARDVIVARLRQLGQEPAARAFEAVDAAKEVWVRRFWIPPAADLPPGWRPRGKAR